MYDYNSLNRVFTYGYGGYRYGSRSPVLIFASLDPEDHDFQRPATAIRLSENPKVMEIMGENYFVNYAASGRKEERWWIFSGDFGQVVRAMDQDAVIETVLIKLEGKPLGALKPADILEACYLPQRHAMTCAECLEKATKTSAHDCHIKRLVMKEKEGKSYWSGTCLTQGMFPPGSLPDEFQHTKSQIDEFLFISPAMTAGHAPAETLREIGEHSFLHVKDRADERSLNQRERKRYQEFKKVECPRCTLKKACPAFHYEAPRNCNGPLLWRWEEIAEEILSNSNIQFSNRELRYLLANSGDLPKRYERCIVGATLHSEYPGEISFRIRRKTRPYPYSDLKEFKDFGEAKKFLEKHGATKTERDVPGRMTMMRKAILIEALSKRGSPRYQCGWGTVSYPIHHIEAVGDRALCQHYSWRSRGGGMISWNADLLHSLENIYERFGHFSRFHEAHQESPLSRKNLKRQLSRKKDTLP